MPEALISRITSLGPGVGSANSLSSSFRSPRTTTPFMSGLLSHFPQPAASALTPRATSRPHVLPRTLADHQVTHHAASPLTPRATSRPHLLPRTLADDDRALTIERSIHDRL